MFVSAKWVKPLVGRGVACLMHVCMYACALSVRVCVCVGWGLLFPLLIRTRLSSDRKRAFGARVEIFILGAARLQAYFWFERQFRSQPRELAETTANMIQPQRCHIMLHSTHQFLYAYSSTRGRRVVKVR